MQISPEALISAPPPPAPWKFAWLTPWRCRALFALLVLYNFTSAWRFLTHNCPIDLSGDEAQYWTWSRHLDLSYYSKGPLIAYIIRASCAVLGNTMPAVRLPALLLAVGTSICTYWLTAKLFNSDRLALGAYLLGAVVPMYLAGGTLMTIDPPFFFCWALATCLVAKGILDESNWPWIIAGVVVGIGFLAKYSMFLWLVIVLLFLLADRTSRRWLLSRWPWLMVLIALAFSAPVIIWNARHGWVSFRHVATQTGANQTGGFSRGNFWEFLGSQFGIINPAIAVMMVAAVAYTFGPFTRSDPHRRQLKFLAIIGGGFFLICMFDSLRTKVQGNWPAPAYFTLLILTAYFIATRLRDVQSWRPWRGWVYGAIIFGLAVQPLLHDATTFYPMVAWINRTFPRQSRPRVAPTNFDLVYKLRGIADPFASTVSAYLADMPPGSFILCEDYQDASQLAFYVKSQPKTYFCGSYWTDPALRRRLTQYDMWPDRQLDRPELIGKDAIYIGTIHYDPFQRSWERIELLPSVRVVRNGLEIRDFPVWRCHGFKGMKRPSEGGGF